MLKKLRNKMLILNMASTLILILISFSVIFSITYSSVQQTIEKSLSRALGIHRFMPPEKDMMRENMPPEGQDTGGEADKRRMDDLRNFSVFVTSSGEVKTNSVFGEDNEFYNTVAHAVVKLNLDSGELKYDNIYWRFITKENPDGSKLIALADVTTEREILLRLVISLALCAAALIVIIFLVSLYFANRSIRPVKEAWDKQKQFVADASHELKTPLAAINTNVDVLLSQPNETIGNQAKWLQYIKSETQRLTNLTGSLLFMARVDSAAQVPMQRTLISDVFESAVMNMEAVAFEKGKIYEYDIAPDIYALANADQITRLCLILIDNAIKYSSEGGRIYIRLALSQKDAAVFSVTNDGDTISKEEQTKIFDRFYRADKSRTGNSYGLGLAMAKEIAALHKAKLTVSSNDEDGTCFSFIIPLLK